MTPAIGNVKYWYWPPTLNIVPDGVGAYATNQPVPDIAEVVRGGALTVKGVPIPGSGHQEGMFCMAVANLIQRANRKIVPTMSDDRYDGGTWAAQNFWGPFRRWKVYPRGTLIGRNFV